MIEQPVFRSCVALMTVLSLSGCVAPVAVGVLGAGTIPTLGGTTVAVGVDGEPSAEALELIKISKTVSIYAPDPTSGELETIYAGANRKIRVMSAGANTDTDSLVKDARSRKAELLLIVRKTGDKWSNTAYTVSQSQLQDLSARLVDVGTGNPIWTQQIAINVVSGGSSFLEASEITRYGHDVIAERFSSVATNQPGDAYCSVEEAKNVGGFTRLSKDCIPEIFKTKK